MKILEKCLIMAWDGILIPARKRDSLEVCTGRGTLARVVVKQEGEEIVAFSLLQTSGIVRDMYFREKARPGAHY